jgi:glycosyltransferase involved in cell wall biosynthesis
MDIFCSTIIPTVNRSTLPKAIYSVLDQGFPDSRIEVIVVNDSGQPLPDADWMHSERVKVIDTNRHERSAARNVGATIAKGKYLHFLDDDDILLPGALKSFWLQSQTDQAGWFCGGWQTSDNNGNIIDEFQPNLNGNIFSLLIAGEGLPLQASIVLNDHFFKAGAFDPTIVGVEDRDLGRRMALIGDIAYVPAVVAKIRIGEVGSTTNWSILAEDDRWGREKALRDQNAFSRLRKSANSSYLRGRVSRACIASMMWNLQRKNGFIAASRLAFAFLFTGVHAFSPDYWRGLKTKIK